MSEILRLDRNGGICVATIDAPPVNVMTLELFSQLADFADAVAADDDVRVVVLRSADPDFFIAHFDVGALVEMPIDGPAERSDRLGRFHRMCERFRTMPKPTICEIAGHVGGGGAELAASCDMRFGARETFVLNQMEVPLGILPGGSGTQRLPGLVGRGRAMEIVLGGVDIDADTAASWGWLNRALPHDRLSEHVDALASRISRFPPEAVAHAKRSLLDAEERPIVDGLLDEQYRFQQLMRTPSAQHRLRTFLERGGQTRAAELRIEELTDDLD